MSFHHAINVDADGMMWACVQQWERGGRHIGYRGRYGMDGKTVNFLDNSIAQIDPETGHILYTKSCAAILRENGLGARFCGPGTLKTHAPERRGTCPVQRPPLRRGDLF